MQILLRDLGVGRIGLQSLASAEKPHSMAYFQFVYFSYQEFKYSKIL